jgi:antitoxin (DNA-binding transcriptional repressor) of toxin-antitoxin stability system
MRILRNIRSVGVKYKIPSRKDRERVSYIAATDAAKHFGRLVNRVREERATYLVERNGHPVAQIGPVETRRTTLRDLVRLFASGSRRRIPEAALRATERALARANRPALPVNPWER